MERKILNIKRKEKIKNNEMRKKINVKDVGCIIRRAKFDYAGRMMR